MSYSAIKFLHPGSVLPSYNLLFLRGIWMLHASPVMRQRRVRIAPHPIDTALRGSAITLAFMPGLSPVAAPWLAAKIIALLLYIVPGSIAIERAKTQRARLAAWLSAQAVFLYIVFTAWAHDPMPWCAL